MTHPEGYLNHEKRQASVTFPEVCDHGTAVRKAPMKRHMGEIQCKKNNPRHKLGLIWSRLYECNKLAVFERQKIQHGNCLEETSLFSFILTQIT